MRTAVIGALFVLLVAISAPVIGAGFTDQPDTYSSSLCSYSGLPIYDWQLANMIKMWIADPGYANMVLVFSECYSGGMMDDIVDKLEGSGDIALLAAALHDKSSYADVDTADRPEGDYLKEVNDELAKTGTAAPTMGTVADTAEREDVSGPNGTKRETPQSTFTGMGSAIKIGKKSDGSDVASKHAILWGGIGSDICNWKDIDRSYNALIAHGFTDADVHVLIGFGPGGSPPTGAGTPPYVDSKATKENLYTAIKAIGSQMNANEQFVFIVADHGNRERTEKTLNKVIESSSRQVVPATITVPGWVLDDAFLDTVENQTSTVPNVSLIIDPPAGMPVESIPSFLGNLSVWVNGDHATPYLIEPVEAVNDNPDVDGWEVFFMITGLNVLCNDVMLEIEYTDPPSFQQFTILAGQIGTGPVPMIQDTTGIFGDGFETGDTSRWEVQVP